MQTLNASQQAVARASQKRAIVVCHSSHRQQQQRVQQRWGSIAGLVPALASVALGTAVAIGLPEPAFAGMCLQQGCSVLLEWVPKGSVASMSALHNHTLHISVCLQT
jgi:hypothetical protein